MGQTVVVGLDGAGWRLIDPWIESGELPNLAAIRDRGSWATSRSCLPPVTFPNWKCYSSGKNPGGFGVFWFERIDLEEGRIEVMNGADFATAELWDYLNDAGYSTGVVNMPTMYPPREIDGVIVCGGPDAVEGEYRSISSGYTYPEGLADELESEHGYRVHPDPLLSSNEERGEEVDAILSALDSRFEVALDLLDGRDLDFVHVTLFYLNVLHHFFWDDEPTRRAWSLVDEWIGWIADMDGVNLVIMSDHGSAPTTTEFYINEWLAREGYLTKRRTIEDYLDRVGLTRENILAVAKRLGAVNLLADLVPERIQRVVPQSAGTKRERKLEKVVLEETRALASGQGPVYLNPTFDLDAGREELIDDLCGVTDGHGEPLFADVHRGEDIYSGPYVEGGPEIVVDQRPGVHVNDGLGRGVVTSAPDRWAAENTPHGIFLADGPDFEARGDLGRIDIRDIAPTVLASYDAAVPSDMDGEILPIVSGTTRRREPMEVPGRDRGEEDDAVAERLKQLGYME